MQHFSSPPPKVRKKNLAIKTFCENTKWSLKLHYHHLGEGIPSQDPNKREIRHYCPYCRREHEFRVPIKTPQLLYRATPSPKNYFDTFYHKMKPLIPVIRYDKLEIFKPYELYNEEKKLIAKNTPQAHQKAQQNLRHAIHLLELMGSCERDLSYCRVLLAEMILITNPKMKKEARIQTEKAMIEMVPGEEKIEKRAQAILDQTSPDFEFFKEKIQK